MPSYLFVLFSQDTGLFTGLNSFKSTNTSYYANTYNIANSIGVGLGLTDGVLYQAAMAGGSGEAYLSTSTSAVFGKLGLPFAVALDAGSLVYGVSAEQDAQIFSSLSSLGLGMAGASIGSLGGPLGTVTGYALGSYFGGKIFDSLVAPTTIPGSTFSDKSSIPETIPQGNFSLSYAPNAPSQGTGFVAPSPYGNLDQNNDSGNYEKGISTFGPPSVGMFGTYSPPPVGVTLPQGSAASVPGVTGLPYNAFSSDGPLQSGASAQSFGDQGPTSNFGDPASGLGGSFSAPTSGVQNPLSILQAPNEFGNPTDALNGVFEAPTITQGYVLAPNQTGLPIDNSAGSNPDNGTIALPPVNVDGSSESTNGSIDTSGAASDAPLGDAAIPDFTQPEQGDFDYQNSGDQYAYNDGGDYYGSGGGDYDGGGGSWGGSGGSMYGPIVVDLTGKGVNITPLSSSNTFFDMAGDGYQHHTALGRGWRRRARA